MFNADKVLNGFFADKLAEGQKLGIYDKNIPASNAESYVTHLLSPAESDVVTKKGIFGGTKVSRFTPFAKERTYPDILAAAEKGVNVKTDRKSTRLNSSHANISYAV